MGLHGSNDGLADAGLAVTQGSNDALAETGLAVTRGSAPLLSTEAVGGTLGRYVIKSVLGSGGMGVVYRAHDPELGRQVALKVVRPGGDGSSQDASRGRLVREAQAMAKLAHPNVIVVHDAGTVGDNVFVAMELVDGKDMATWESESQRPWLEVLHVYLQAARGLAAAHRAGIVHRDFKPANVLLGTDGRVRVLDFGLARTVDDVTSERSRRSSDLDMTQTGAVMGTPLYMSPEQHLGERADARSDQFSFCVTLYHALYGEFPFQGRTYEALADAVTHGVPAPPPRKTAVPSALGKVIMRGLSVARDDRYASTNELIAALERAVPRRRWPYFAVAAAVVALAIVVAMIARPSATGAPIAMSFARNQQTVTVERAIDAFDLSPDGKHLAWVTPDGVAFRDLATGVTTRLSETHTVTDIRWSPSGDAVLLATNQGAVIRKPSGGEPRVFERNQGACHAAWSPDGTKILWHCDDVDHKPFEVIDVADGKTTTLPDLVHDGERVTDFDWSSAGIALALFSPDGTFSVRVASGEGTQLRSLGAQPQIATIRWNRRATRIYTYRVAANEGGVEIAYCDVRGGTPIVVLYDPVAIFTNNPSLAISADERAIFYVGRKFEQDVARLTLPSGGKKFLTGEHSMKFGLSMSRDNATIAFAAGRDEKKRLFAMPAIGGQVRELAVPEADIRTTAFSPDGHELAFTTFEDDGSYAAWIIPLAPGGAPRRLKASGFEPAPLAWRTADTLALPKEGLENFYIINTRDGASVPLWPTPTTAVQGYRFSADGTRIVGPAAFRNTGGLVTFVPPSLQPQKVLAHISTMLAIGWSQDQAWVYATDQPTTEPRLRVTAISSGGDGVSRFLGALDHGFEPVVATDESAVLWITDNPSAELRLASLEQRPPLTRGPPAPPPEPPPPPTTNTRPENLALAGLVDAAPAGWNVIGDPIRAAVSDNCGRAGQCVVLDAQSGSGLVQYIDATAYRGQRLRIVLQGRVEAGATLAVAVQSGVYARTEIGGGRIDLGKQSWGRCELIADVAPDAIYIVLKAKTFGTGRAWVSDFSIERVR